MIWFTPSAVDLLAKQKVQAIIALESIVDAKFLVVLGDEAQVPILSLSPTPSSNKHPYFFQIIEDEATQLKGISALAESFGWKNVIVICEDTDNGQDMAKLIANAFRLRGILLTYTSLILTPASSEVVYKELYRLKTMHSKFFVIHVSPSLASHLFLNAKHLGMMDAGYKWIITSKTMNFLNFMDGEVIESMQGVVGFKSYIPKSRDLQKFISKWREDYELTNINAYAIWAYDAVSALAMAVESTQALSLNSKDLNMTGSAQWTTAELLNQMLRISFDGLGGAFQFMNGRLSAQVLEIINVIGKGERRVGFWRSEDAAAFTKKLVNSFSDDGLDAIVWPGGIQANPTHRMLQMSTRLRIGIPLKFRSFGGLFKVYTDARTNKTDVSGYCVDVLLTCFHALNQNVELEFYLVNGYVAAGSGHYGHLIDQVHAGEFDAGVGDITITSNRSKYVDFTLPYSDLGLGILSRNADTSMWIFMKPLSSDLWVVSGCFLILLGFVIWILEHRTNEEFQGSPVEQIGTTIWFAFSTIVYAHRQKLQSNLSRFVVTVWLFVVLVLVSSYTATLSSLLTVEQIQLASKGGSIVYTYDTFVAGVLGGSFKKEKLFKVSDALELEYYADALSRGSKKGGVDAIVIEIPYIKEFLVKYPTGYTMTPYEVITNGFGFPFPLGSPWAPLISTQIAKLREDGTLKMLENKWLDPGSKESAPLQKVLNFRGLRGLFLISGVSMAAALFLYMLYYIHDKWHFC
nr:extracellular ligand-binding receptor [Tanacetum cinerariifolium]